MNLRIAHITKVACLTAVFFLPLQCQSEEAPLQLSTTHYRLITELFKTAVANMEANPVFRIHGMGMDINKEIGGIIGKDSRMQNLRLSAHGLEWEKLPNDTQSKFHKLLEDAMNPERSHYSVKETDLSIPEVWQEALSNPRISLNCCGGGCQFQVDITTYTPLGYVHLDHNTNQKGESVCPLSWNIPESMMGELSQAERYDIKHGRYNLSLNDKDCDGSLVFYAAHYRPSVNKKKRMEKIRMGEPSQEWIMEIEALYNKLLKAFNPIQHGKMSEDIPCDI